MPADLYPSFEGGGPPEQSPPTTEPDRDETEKEQEPAGETVLVPRTALAGQELQPGDKIEMEVVHLYDDEVELKPASTEPTETPTASSADEEIEAMAGKGDE